MTVGAAGTGGSAAAACVTLIDLAGHVGYQRTTLGGLMGAVPDAVVVVLAANACDNHNNTVNHSNNNNMSNSNSNRMNSGNSTTATAAAPVAASCVVGCESGSVSNTLVPMLVPGMLSRTQSMRTRPHGHDFAFITAAHKNSANADAETDAAVVSTAAATVCPVYQAALQLRLCAALGVPAIVALTHADCAASEEGACTGEDANCTRAGIVDPEDDSKDGAVKCEEGPSAILANAGGFALNAPLLTKYPVVEVLSRTLAALDSALETATESRDARDKSKGALTRRSVVLSRDTRVFPVSAVTGSGLSALARAIATAPLLPWRRNTSAALTAATDCESISHATVQTTAATAADDTSATAAVQVNEEHDGESNESVVVRVTGRRAVRRAGTILSVHVVRGRLTVGTVLYLSPPTTVGACSRSLGSQSAAANSTAQSRTQSKQQSRVQSRSQSHSCLQSLSSESAATETTANVSVTAQNTPASAPSAVIGRTAITTASVAAAELCAVTVRTLRVHRTDVSAAVAGQSASFRIDRRDCERCDPRRGMVGASDPAAALYLCTGGNGNEENVENDNSADAANVSAKKKAQQFGLRFGVTKAIGGVVEYMIPTQLASTNNNSNNNNNVSSMCSSMGTRCASPAAAGKPPRVRSPAALTSTYPVSAAVTQISSSGVPGECATTVGAAVSADGTCVNSQLFHSAWSRLCTQHNDNNIGADTDSNTAKSDSNSAAVTMQQIKKPAAVAVSSGTEFVVHGTGISQCASLYTLTPSLSTPLDHAVFVPALCVFRYHHESISCGQRLVLRQGRRVVALLRVTHVWPVPLTVSSTTRTANTAAATSPAQKAKKSAATATAYAAATTTAAAAAAAGVAVARTSNSVPVGNDSNSNDTATATKLGKTPTKPSAATRACSDGNAMTALDYVASVATPIATVGTGFIGSAPESRAVAVPETDSEHSDTDSDSDTANDTGPDSDCGGNGVGNDSHNVRFAGSAMGGGIRSLAALDSDSDSDSATDNDGDNDIDSESDSDAGSDSADSTSNWNNSNSNRVTGAGLWGFTSPTTTTKSSLADDSDPFTAANSSMHANVALRSNVAIPRSADDTTANSTSRGDRGGSVADSNGAEDSEAGQGSLWGTGELFGGLSDTRDWMEIKPQQQHKAKAKTQQGDSNSNAVFNKKT